jgi:hypothetical protein
MHRRSEMTSRLTVTKFIIYLVVIAFTAGCTTMRSLPATDAQSLTSQLEVGDEIKIMRNDDTDVTFKVSAVSDEGISGDGVFVAYSDIRQVQVRQSSTGKTVGLVAAIVAGLAIAIIGSNIDSGVDFSNQ